MSHNRMKLNADKTEAILFSHRPHLGQQNIHSSNIDSEEILFSESVRDLGVVLNSRLSFKQHVSRVCRTAYYELRRIGSIRRYLTCEATEVIIKACVLSRLDYCCSLLIGASQALILPMQRVQNAAARMVLKASYREPCTPLLHQLRWLPVSERIKYRVACLCFQFFLGSLPTYLSETLEVYSPPRALRSSNDSRLLVSKRFNRKTHGFRAFSIFAPSFWNSLPRDLRHCSLLGSFKSQLKSHLFDEYFKQF